MISKHRTAGHKAQKSDKLTERTTLWNALEKKWTFGGTEPLVHASRQAHLIEFISPQIKLEKQSKLKQKKK